MATGKGFFLAPSHQRIEISTDRAYNPAVKAAAAAARRQHAADSQAAEAAAKATSEAMAKAVALMPKMTNVTIVDGQAEKCMMLMPMTKLAMLMDMRKMKEEMKKSGNPAPPDLFEMVRRIVREGSSGMGEKVERLGKKEIDGREAVGFLVHNAMSDMGNMGDMTLWADPETARPIRIEMNRKMFTDVRMVMSNFRYNVDLDPSLFSLEPPAGYSTQTVDVTMPVEEDLLRALRVAADHNKGVFPEKLGMKEVMNFKMDKATAEKMEAEMNKIAAKYGGKEELRAKYGKNIPPEIMAEIMKATMPIMQERTRKQMPTRLKEMRKRQRGLLFYQALKPENDPHYVGGGVKLGTPDCPILWYKPTGADKYRVIYADLSVKELTPDEVEKLPEARSKQESAGSPVESHEAD